MPSRRCGLAVLLLLSAHTTAALRLPLAAAKQRGTLALPAAGRCAPLLLNERSRSLPESRILAAQEARAAATYRRQLQRDSTPLSRSRYLLACTLIGAATGAAVALFKLAIGATAAACYGGVDPTHGWTRSSQALRGARVLVPAMGGLMVALITAAFRGRLGPTLAEHVAEVEQQQPLRPAACVGRSAAAVSTLGTGNSLGPEGPSVEIGVGMARLVAGVTARTSSRRRRQHLAAGAAAGVAAGFNAPLAGVFFALEVASEAVKNGAARPPPAAAELAATSAKPAAAAVTAMSATPEQLRLDAQSRAELDCKTRTSISGLVIASLFSATTAQRMLGNEHALAPRAWAPCAMRFMDLPLYVGLGLASGLVAIVFEKATAASRALFAPSAAVRRADADGRSGGSGGSGGGLLRWIPTPLRPAFGGVVCGLVGLLFPQVSVYRAALEAAHGATCTPQTAPTPLSTP